MDWVGQTLWLLTSTDITPQGFLFFRSCVKHQEFCLKVSNVVELYARIDNAAEKHMAQNWTPFGHSASNKWCSCLEASNLMSCSFWYSKQILCVLYALSFVCTWNVVDKLWAPCKTRAAGIYLISSTWFDHEHYTYCKFQCELKLLVFQENMNLSCKWNCLQTPHMTNWCNIYQTLATADD
jgi:hypothetical protein